ncbi:conserved exported hypothetical protein [Thiomonas sp. X19]|uniref:hypothetical protein n=1 Tax=Thiomonas sp. X19 TaxID=1050370 RepID=UPI000B75A650|nr:hypothetical protein [Thiomonas sp. X19]SCC92407.1 conserved exported hypothetical protein [Thiomonas sp. X19]
MNTRTTPLHKTLLGALALGTLLVATSAQAETHWEHAHPRRDQVLDRTQHLNRRIVHERREGELTAAQAHALHAQVRQTRLEQRAMAQTNGGYITKVQQAGLNQQQNAISRKIGP